MATKPKEPDDQPTRESVERLFWQMFDERKRAELTRLATLQHEAEAAQKRLLDDLERSDEYRKWKTQEADAELEQKRVKGDYGVTEKTYNEKLDKVYRLYLANGLTEAVKRAVADLVEATNAE